MGSFTVTSPLVGLVGRWALFSLVLVGVVGFGTPAAAQQAEDSTRSLQAGAAASNITPPLGALIVGGWRPYPATHIHDELYARCLVIDNGETRLAIVLCDNVGIPREVYDQAKTWIEEETGLPPSHVLTAATHTHSGPSARIPNKLKRAEDLSDYQRFLARRIADGVRRAIKNLEPARIGWGSVDAPEHVFNRRWFIDPEHEELLRNPFGGMDQVRMNPPRNHEALIKPAGPTDPEVCFLSVQSTEGRPIALLANYSLHYVGGVRGGEISADYFGVFADRIQELLEADRLDPPFVGVLSNGTSGDVNNIDFQGQRGRREPYEQMRIVGRDVAEKVFEAHQDLVFHDWVPLGAVHRELVLQARKPDAERIAWAEAVLEQPEDSEGFHRRERIYAERVSRLTEAPDEVAIPLQVLRIGEVGVAAIPFEVFAETGLELKERSPLPKSFTIELANGSFGYLPTPRQHEWGGYETWMGTNYVEVEAAPKIVEQLLDMFDALMD